MVLGRRICLAIRSFLNWWSFSLFSWPYAWFKGNTVEIGSQLPILSWGFKKYRLATAYALADLKIISNLWSVLTPFLSAFLYFKFNCFYDFVTFYTHLDWRGEDESPTWIPRPGKKENSLDRKAVTLLFCLWKMLLLHNIKLTLHVSALETWFLLLRYTPRLKAIWQITIFRSTR